ncbi:MAG: branched-chain amino acid ABC transporter substrate-binding protein [Actinomycetota bacterium]|nr:branched-chain amino acid ABC transporter substrate-binding protein [Actinomycetota bacterium]
MRRSNWLSIFSLLFALMLLGASCADEGGGGNGTDPGGGDAQAECDADEFGCVEVAEGDPVTLGTLLVISGENASLGLDSQAGAEIAAEMRDNEVAGHPVEWVHADDGCAAEGGQAGGQQLASNEQIVAVVGTSCSSAGVPAAQILSKAGIVLISPSNTAPDLTDPASHEPFYLRTAHNDKIQGKAMSDFVTSELGAKTAATIHDGSPYAEGLANVFAEEFAAAGGEITNEEAIGVGDKDMKPTLTTIAAAKPDFLYFPVFVAEGGLIASQAREIAGLADTDLGGADGMLTPDWIEAAGADAAEGAYLSGPDLEFSGDFYEAEFLPAYEEKVGSEPTSVFHAHSFDAVNLLLDAIEEVAIEEDGSLFIPRTALKDKLFETSGYAGVVGELTCDENGDCNPGASISVSIVEKGDFKRIWP